MNNKKPRLLLSICIPNYRRPEFLQKNLQAIAKQNLPEIEIVIIDDNSPDDIRKIIDNFKEKHPKINLKFKKNSKNLGFDKNVLKTVGLAEGQYCWLLSNDDQILSGSIKEIIKTINQRPDIALILINYQRYDHILKKITSRKMISLNKDLFFDDANNFFFYKASGSYFKSLGLNCLTMSANIFRRDYWNQARNSVKKHVGHNFIHLFIITSVIKKQPRVCLISSPQLRYTSNNHRIWDNSIWHDIRYFLLNHLLEIGYNKEQILNLKKALKTDEINEKILVLSQSFPKVHRFLFPYIRKVRLFLGHHV